MSGGTMSWNTSLRLLSIKHIKLAKIPTINFEGEWITSPGFLYVFFKDEKSFTDMKTMWAKHIWDGFVSEIEQVEQGFNR